jgi:hypothetical protein
MINTVGNRKGTPVDLWTRIYDKINVDIASTRDVYEIREEAINTLMQFNDPPVLFRRGNKIVRVCTGELGEPFIEIVDQDILRSRFEQTATFYVTHKIDEGKFWTQIKHVPQTVLTSILSNVMILDLHILYGVTSTPIIREDGSIVSNIGYDSHSKMYYLPIPDFILPDIPKEPTQQDAIESAKFLCDIFSDFPFAGQIDRANMLAKLCVPVLANLFDWRAMMSIVDAPVMGSGKGLLESVAYIVSVGSRLSAIPFTDDEEELRKKITTFLLSGSPLAVFDNVGEHQVLRSPVLASLITSQKWQDRLMRTMESLELQSRTIWSANGNNIQIGGDMTRRVYRIRIVPDVEYPSQRDSSSFKIPDLEKYVEENRGEIIWHILRMAKAWIIAGRPKPEHPISESSFTEFVRLFDGMLNFAGVTGFLGDREELMTMVDPDRLTHIAFLDAWYQKFGSDEIAVGDLSKGISEGSSLLNSMPAYLTEIQGKKSAKSFQSAVGKYVSSLADRRFGDPAKYISRRKDSHSKTYVYRVIYTGGDSSNGDRPTVRNIDERTPFIMAGNEQAQQNGQKAVWPLSVVPLPKCPTCNTNKKVYLNPYGQYGCQRCGHLIPV